MTFGIEDKLMVLPDPDEDPRSRISAKHNEYYAGAKRYRILYYGTRLVSGLCAGILPFVVYSLPNVATGLAIAIVLVTVFDTVFAPKDKWKSMSKATDLLYISELKRQGKYEEFKEAIEVILSTEDQQMLNLLGIDDVMKAAQKAVEDSQHSKA